MCSIGRSTRQGSVHRAATGSRCDSSSSPTRPRRLSWPSGTGSLGVCISSRHRASGDAIEAESGDVKATKAVMSKASVAAANEFAKNLADVPAMIVACANLEETHPTDTDLGRLSIVGGASVYPVMQNLCLASAQRGRGHHGHHPALCMFEPQVKELLGIPDEYATAAHIAAGYPAKPFPTKLTRHPVEEIASSTTLISHCRPPLESRRAVADRRPVRGLSTRRAASSRIATSSLAIRSSPPSSPTHRSMRRLPEATGSTVIRAFYDHVFVKGAGDA